MPADFFQQAADIIKADNVLPAPAGSASAAPSSSSIANPAADPASSTSTLSPSVAAPPGRVLLDSSSSAVGLAEVGPTLSSSPTQSTAVFSTTLPSDLPAQLSSIHIVPPTPGTNLAVGTTAAAQPTLSGAPLISQSVIGVLTSAGLPASVVSSLAPIVLGSPAESGATAAATGTSMEQQQRRAAIDAVLQWLLTFFHLN